MPGSTIGDGSSDNVLEVTPSTFSSQFSGFVDVQTCLSGKVSATMTGISDLALSEPDPALSRTLKAESEKPRVVARVSKLESKQLKLKAKVSSSKEQVNNFRADKDIAGSETFAVVTDCDKLNDRSTSQRTELEGSLVISAKKTGFVKLLERRLHAKETSCRREGREVDAKVANAD